METNRLIFEQGPLAGHEISLADRPLLFGRGNTADVVIPNANVSRQHARLTPEGAGYRLEDLESLNGTFINELRLEGSQVLVNGDRVRLGTEVVLRIVLVPKDEGTIIAAGFPAVGATQVVRPAAVPEPQPHRPPPPSDATVIMRPEAASPPPMEPAVPAHLTLTLPDGQKNEHSLTEAEITLGRLAENDIAVAVATISRRQLKLIRQGDHYRLDLEPGSPNPVFVNGERVTDQHLLQDGDELSLGYPGGETTVLARYWAYKPAQSSAPAQPPAPARSTSTITPPPTRAAPPPPRQDVGDMTISRTGPPPSRAPAPASSDPNQTFIGALPAAAVTEPPQLVVTAYGKEPALYTLTDLRTRIGRNADNDIVLENRFVSRHHAEIERRVTGYYVVPSPNLSNPLLLDGAPVMEATRLKHGAKLRLGGFDPSDMVTLVYLSPSDEPAPASQQTVQFSESKVVSIGRAAENDIVLPAPVVSRFHAQVERIGQRYRVRDLGSGNGTFVNGNAVHGDTWVQAGDALHIGPYRLQVGSETITQHDESQSGMRIEAHDLNKRVRKDLNVLQNISLAFLPREFIVVVGQSGGGKSTLVDAIAGYRPATHGKVIVNDTIDVYKNFDAIRNTIGYVPQKDIIHMELTVFQALDYAAQLRMPADTTREERHQRIAEVMEELDLSHRRDTQISELSGGQQKRVSIGVELLTKPGLFFLDEPTSGLDPGTETELMQLMRRLADQGRTIVLITHATKNVMLADRVVFLARGGYLAWFGPPEEALTYFDQFRTERQRRTKPIEFDDIYNLLDHEELGAGKDWAERYRKHEAYQKYIARPLGEDRAGAVRAAPDGKARNKLRPVSALRQFLILSTRSLNILARDRATLGLMLLSAPLMASLDFILAFGVGRNPFGFDGGDFNNVIVTLIVLTNTAILVGGLVMMRELVKEREIYKRERMVNLRLSSYIFSKLWFALLLALYQSFWFTLIRHLAFDMPGGPEEVFYFFVTVFLMVLAGMMMGLFTSAIAPNANAAPLILVMFILPQIVLSGALVPLPSFASAVASSRWAFQAAIATGGAGSDVAGDVCWVDKTAAERDAMTRAEKDAQCDCLGANALRESSCNFPGLAEFYDPAIDAPEPVKPAEPRDQPEPPVFPDAPESPVFPDPPEAPVFPAAPEQPADMNNPLAVQAYLEALEAYNDESTALREEFEADLEAYNDESTALREDYEADLEAYNDESTALSDAFEADLDAFKVEQEGYKDAIEVYQDELTEFETDRATAIGSAEASIKRFYEDYGWTFVDQDDRDTYLGVLLQTWLAQSIIITVLFVATIIVQKSRDVR